MSASSPPQAATDGAHVVDSRIRKATHAPQQDELCCIFVHAGAGYHSHQNERIHLEACNDAAQIAMLILKNGGTALDAVEAAIKTLEDREITNAGYGSNLAMDGIVECDASIVDHHGRSGAVGAVAHIKNPISLARMVHDHTMSSLTLRRVPPNLLVAQGATEFASEMGMPILPHDALVSPAAKERWIRWRADLKAAERKAKKSGSHPSCWKIRTNITPEEELAQENIRERHTQDMVQGYPFLSSSSSATQSDDALSAPMEDSTTSNPSLLPSENTSASWYADETVSTPDMVASIRGDISPPSVAESSRNAFINSTQQVPTMSQYRDSRTLRETPHERIAEDAQMEDAPFGFMHEIGRRAWSDGSGEDSDATVNAATMQKPSAVVTPSSTSLGIPLPGTPIEKLMEAPSPLATTPLNHVKETAPLPPTPAVSTLLQDQKDDHITDTVGAIAVDSWGNIACGASSGGIGMKYRGRVGPAALVGIGAAVIPINIKDPDQTCVATVTSGTGEHMATTMAATVSAERLHQSMKKNPSGEYVEVTEDEALQAMIENEFMGNVKHSNSAGAIGILGLKKFRSGMLLYYGHNTDSFAMASMSSEEEIPVCTMSRSTGNGQIAQGGRMMNMRRSKKTKTARRQN
ncbi:N-terminal nucleophile aminohydrolase [Pyrenochaeta sp. DS3sAY3a]|nr:N-terminal nucleophile aminohydrolase [Pyrenochaeta sp. DS3sAY3a]